MTRHPTPPLIAFVGVVGLVVVVLMGVFIETVGAGQPVAFDLPWHDALAAWRIPPLEIMSSTLAIVGGTAVMAGVSLAIVVTLMVLRRFADALVIAATVLLSSGVTTLLKALVARPRPADGSLGAITTSFPSGHTTTAAALTIAIALLYPRVWSWMLVAVWVALMAFSRTYLLVHWLSDVIAGALVGASVALIVAGIARFLKERSPRTAPNAR